MRLPLIGMKELLHEVRPQGLASADSIMDAISLKVESRDIELPHRYFYFIEYNYRTTGGMVKIYKQKFELCVNKENGHLFEVYFWDFC